MTTERNDKCNKKRLSDSPLKLTLLIVGIIFAFLIIGAILYILYPLPPPPPETPLVTYSKTPVINGKITITIVQTSQNDVSWDEVQVMLFEGNNSAAWEISARDLDGGSPIAKNYSAKSLGNLIVCCWVCDVTGDGYVSKGDYFELFTYSGAPTFSSNATYITGLMYEYTANMMGFGISFTG